MHHNVKKFIAGVVLLMMLISGLPAGAIYAYQITGITIQMEEKQTGVERTVAACEVEFPGNLYVSVSGVASLLANTQKACRIYRDNWGGWIVESGAGGTTFESGYTGWSAEPTQTTVRKNGQNNKYYTLETGSDLYMTLLDIQMLLDVRISYQNGVYVINAGQPFAVDLNNLEDTGYFDYLHGVLLGDITNGRIYFCHNENKPIPLGSTSKLMTFYVLAKQLESGLVTYQDTVTVSRAAARMSASTYGSIGLSEGQQVSLEDLLYAMLLKSSNEAAIAIAEYCAGSEKAFVEEMNREAEALGLLSARFYNASGVPAFVDGGITAKTENTMSTKDMFVFVWELLGTFPWLTQITKETERVLPTIGITVQTTNQVFHNVDGITGLKTGTTPSGGYSLICTRDIEINGEPHTIVSMVYGADEERDRVQVSELLLKSRYWELQDSSGWLIP